VGRQGRIFNSADAGYYNKPYKLFSEVESLKKDRDPFVLWMVSGIVAVAVRDTYSLLAKLIGLAKFNIWQVGASLMVPKAQTFTLSGNILGLLVDAVVGGLFGVMIGLLLEWRGNRNYLLKGLGVGLLAWMFFYGILYHNLPFTQTSAPGDPLSNISAFIGHSIFGITGAWFYVKILSERFVQAENDSSKDSAANRPRKLKLTPQPAKKLEEDKERAFKKPKKIEGRH